jgi:DNA-binding NarL/FixJ family response regulator
VTFDSLVVSFYDIPEAKEEALRAGAIAYLPKSSVWRLVPILRKIQVGDSFGSSRRVPSWDMDTRVASHDRPDLENLLTECKERNCRLNAV